MKKSRHEIYFFIDLSFKNLKKNGGTFLMVKRSRTMIIFLIVCLTAFANEKKRKDETLSHGYKN